MALSKRLFVRLIIAKKRSLIIKDESTDSYIIISLLLALHLIKHQNTISNPAFN